MTPARWQAWRKRKGEMTFSKVDGCVADTKAGCYQLLMQTVELGGHEDIRQDLLIMPEGEIPRAQTYRDRMMRPGI